MSKRFSVRDRRAMKLALELARKGLGKTAPNPMVGAVITFNGKVIGRGFHRFFGGPHAEEEALRGLSSSVLQKARLYTTLEPCVSFLGKKNGSCAEMLVKRGVRHVVNAQRDPHPEVNGRGIALLRRNGVKVDTGLERVAAQELNRVYVKNIQSSLPYVALKLATSLDGRIATSTHESRWVTGKKSRRHVHLLRSQYQAVLTTSETVLRDDPHLGVRIVAQGDSAKQPLRILLDRRLRVPMSAKIFRDCRVMVVTSSPGPYPLEKAGVRYIRISDFSDLTAIFSVLYRQGVMSILVEAGGRLAAALMRQHLVDRLYYFVAPSFLGSDGIPAVQSLGISRLENAVVLRNVMMKVFGRDILVEGTLSPSP